MSYIGCYRDTANRAMSNTSNGGYLSLDKCQQLAREQGFKYYGGQDGRKDSNGIWNVWCTGSNDLTSAQKYGSATNCINANGTMLGGGWSNAVYNVPTYPANADVKEVNMPLLLAKEQELKTNLNQYQVLKAEYTKMVTDRCLTIMPNAKLDPNSPGIFYLDMKNKTKMGYPSMQSFTSWWPSKSVVVYPEGNSYMWAGVRHVRTANDIDLTTCKNGVATPSKNIVKMSADLLALNDKIIAQANEIKNMITTAPFNSVLFKKYQETNTNLETLISTMETQKLEYSNRQNELITLEGQISQSKIETKQSNLVYLFLILTVLIFLYGIFSILVLPDTSKIEIYFFILSICVILYFGFNYIKDGNLKTITDPVVDTANYAIDTTTSIIENA